MKDNSRISIDLNIDLGLLSSDAEIEVFFYFEPAIKQTNENPGNYENYSIEKVMYKGIDIFELFSDAAIENLIDLLKENRDDYYDY